MEKNIRSVPGGGGGQEKRSSREKSDYKSMLAF